MKTVNIHEAKIHLSQLVERAGAGEEIVIARRGKPVARLLALNPTRSVRKPGAWKGRVWISDDFDAPLPADLLDAFAGRER
jgi:prevent-host-death family protein